MSAAFRPVGRVLMGVALCVGVLVVALKEGCPCVCPFFFLGAVFDVGLGALRSVRLFMGKTKETDICPSLALSDSNRIQTYNLLIRSQMLYSVELWSHCFSQLRCKGTVFF